VIYETGCTLPPGSYILTVAVLDSGSWEIGGAERNVPVRERSAGIPGDVILWTSSAGDILAAADAAAVGIRDTGSGHGFVPRSERRFGPRETGLLYSVVCPPPGGTPSGETAIEVKRSIFVEDKEVASFPSVRLGLQAGEGAGTAASSSRPGACEGIFAPIPPGRLGLGGYQYEIQVTGIGAEPIVRRAGFAVEEPGKSNPEM
jgi:hypothetical protein